MWRLRAGLKALGLAAAVVVGAGLAVLVPAAEPVPAAHAQAGGGGAEQGMIVVVDRGNDRLQMFYPDGTFALKFGAGYGGASSIDVGPDGRIMVVHGGSVHAFHPNGTYASLVVGVGVGGVGLASYLSQVAVASDGRIVVGESSGRVQVFSPDGGFESVFDAHVPVVGIDVGPDGRIVVSDYGGWMVRAFHLNGTPAFSFPTVGPSRGGGPTEVAVGPDGAIVTLEGGERVNVYRPSVLIPNGTNSNGTIFSRVHLLPNGTLPNGTLPNGPSTFTHFPINGTTYQPGPNGTLVAVPGIEAFSAECYSYYYNYGSGYGCRGAGLAVDRDGRIVVGNVRDSDVTVFHPNGSLALTFGGYGSVQSGFDRPTDAAVGPDGRIVVAEPGNHTISVFHPNGTLAFAFGGHGHGDDAFYEPRHVAVAPDGRIVVGDTVKHRILVFEPDGMPALAFGSRGSGAGQLNGIRDVAVGPDGSIAVSHRADKYYGGRVQVFSPDGKTAFELGEFDRHDVRVAVAPDGRIVVGGFDAYTGGSMFRVFDPNGTEAFTVSFDWRADGVAVGPDGRIVAVGDGRGQVFTPDLEFLFATEIDVDAVSVAVGPSGEIVVVDDRDDRVQVFNPNGAFAFSLLPDLSEGRFNGVGLIAVGPVMPPPRGDPEPLWTSIEPEDGGAPILRNFTGAGDAANVTIDVGSLAEGPGGADALNGSESSIVVFPPVETVVAASFAEVTFPPNVTASHVPAGGLLGLRVATALPTAEQVQAALGRSVNGSGPELVVLLQSVVEVGADQSRIAFDLPIRIALEGAAGGRAFYIEGPNGTIVPIDEACAADDGDAVHEQLGGAGECQMDAEDGGTAKIVYTYHLTKFGTVSTEGPVPVRTDAVDPPPPPPPVVVPVNVTLPFGGGGGGGVNATNGTAGPPPAVPPQPQPQPATPGPPVDTCAVSIDFPALDMSARPGEYSEPVGQVVFNAGSLPLARVEVMATPWHDGSGPPVPPPMPGVPPPYSGPTQGRTAGAFTAYMIASLPASVTEVSEGPRVVNDRIVAGVYEPLADDGSGTAVLEGLGPGAWAPLSFRLNLTAYDGLLAGALVQSVTYQAECVPPAPPS